MALGIGHVAAIFRYPIKSMAGEALATAQLGWHGIDGDRRLAARRIGHEGGRPWLTASKLPELVRYLPLRRAADGPDALPACVRCPDGRELPVGPELAAELADRHGHPVDILRLDHGIFDDAAISVITAGTVDAISAASGQPSDVRRFRPNVVIHSDAPRAFEEDGWLSGALAFADGGPEVHVTMRDLRCVMVNLDPESDRADPEVLKAVARLNDGHAGVYGTVVRCGRLHVGQRVEWRS
jgi:uncharacterized protein YcbX